MILLALGVALFSALHLIPALPELKATVIARVGQRAYGPVFGVASIVALALIVMGWRVSDFVPVYEPAAWGRHANFGLTLVGFICLGIFLFRGALRQRLRFPMGIAVLFWATGHLLANGDHPEPHPVRRVTDLRDTPYDNRNVARGAANAGHSRRA